MKYRIYHESGRWHVKEPNGEVVWHFDDWNKALCHLDLMELGDFLTPIIATENATHPPRGDRATWDRISPLWTTMRGDGE